MPEKEILNVRVDPETRELVFLVAKRPRGRPRIRRKPLPQTWEKDYFRQL